MYIVLGVPLLLVSTFKSRLSMDEFYILCMFCQAEKG